MQKVTGIDVDKMDYMKRDAKALGLKTKFNFLRFVEAGQPKLVEVPFSSSRKMAATVHTLSGKVLPYWLYMDSHSPGPSPSLVTQSNPNPNPSSTFTLTL